MNTQTMALRERRFRSVPRKVSYSSGRLELSFPNTTYQITKWPDWKFSYRSNGAATKSAINPIAQYALLQTLEQLRSISSLPEQRLAVYGLMEDMPVTWHVRLAGMGSQYWLGVDFLAAIPAALGILESSPPLFAATAVYWHDGRLAEYSKQELEVLCQSRQRRIAECLGFGNSEAICKILRKLERYELTPEAWCKLGCFLRKTSGLAPLLHAKSVPNPAISFITEEDPAGVWNHEAKMEYLSTVLTRGREAPKIDVCGILEVGTQLRRFGLFPPDKPSLKGLTKCFRAGLEMMADTPLATGPTVGLLGVCPITTPRDLRAEGTQMSHCAGEWFNVLSALKGETCFYRMFIPERATISLQRSFPQSEWTLGQIRGVRNSPLSPSVDSLIREAFHNAGVAVANRSGK